MMRIPEENEDDDDEPRFSTGSLSCLFPILPSNDSPRKSLCYDKLRQQPLRLGVLKLDGSSFEIEVGKSVTVGELKKAVEAAFRHLPKEGPGKVSWEHVWGQFCLCHEGQKLVTDSDYISLFGIKDGDQLQFVHHASTAYNFVKIQLEREEPDSDDEPAVSSTGLRQKTEKEGGHRIEIAEVNQDDKASSDDDTLSRCKYRLRSLLRCWFPYDRLPKSRAKSEEETSSPSPQSPCVARGNKQEMRGESSKGK